MKNKLITILTVVAICTGTAYADLTPIPNFKSGKNLVIYRVVGNNKESIFLKTVQDIGGKVGTANCDKTLIKEVPKSESASAGVEQRFSATMINTLASEDSDKVCGLAVSVESGNNETPLIVVRNKGLVPAGYDAQHVELKKDSVSEINNESHRLLEFEVKLDKF